MLVATVEGNRMPDRSLDEFLGGGDDEGEDGDDASVDADASVDVDTADAPEETVETGVTEGSSDGTDSDSETVRDPDAVGSAAEGRDGDGPDAAASADAVDAARRQSSGSRAVEEADRGDGDDDPTGTSDATAAGSVPVAPDAVAPATPTARWAPGGEACADCERSVTRLWHEDGRTVCADCKDW
jgi:hypothetical protein